MTPPETCYCNEEQDIQYLGDYCKCVSPFDAAPWSEADKKRLYCYNKVENQAENKHLVEDFANVGHVHKISVFCDIDRVIYAFFCSAARNLVQFWSFSIVLQCEIKEIYDKDES